MPRDLSAETKIQCHVRGTHRRLKRGGFRCDCERIGAWFMRRESERSPVDDWQVTVDKYGIAYTWCTS